LPRVPNHAMSVVLVLFQHTSFSRFHQRYVNQRTGSTARLAFSSVRWFSGYRLAKPHFQRKLFGNLRFPNNSRVSRRNGQTMTGEHYCLTSPQSPCKTGWRCSTILVLSETGLPVYAQVCR
jgi:hypothetical protein